MSSKYDLDKDLAGIGLSVEGIATTTRNLSLHEGVGAIVAATPQMEGTKVIRAGRTGKKTKEKKFSSSQRAAERRRDRKRKGKRKAYYRHNRKKIKKRRRFLMKVKGLLHAVKKHVSNFMHKATSFAHKESAVPNTKGLSERVLLLMSKPAPAGQGLSGVIESLQDLQQSRATCTNEEVVQAFSRLSLLSNGLSEHFLETAEDFDEHAMAEEIELAGEFFEALSIELAEGSSALNTHVGDRFNLDGLWEEFVVRHAFVMEGLQLFGVMEGLLSEKQMAALERDADPGSYQGATMPGKDKVPPSSNPPPPPTPMPEGKKKK